MNNITKTAIGCAALMLALTGCSQQQVSGDSSQVAGSSQQVAGSSQQVAGSSQQVAGSSQQVSPEQVTKECPACNAPKVEPVATTAKPTPPASKPPVRVARNPWIHVHPAIPNCTDSIKHTHKYANRNHHHKYSCTKARPRPRPTRRTIRTIDVGALQRKLKAKGFYRGPINGVINAETRDALKRYQQRRRR